MQFPEYRAARVRGKTTAAKLFEETQLNAAQLIAPLALCSGKGVRRELAGLPGSVQCSADMLRPVVDPLLHAGVGAVYLTEVGADGGAAAEGGVLARAISTLHDTWPDLTIISELDLPPPATGGASKGRARREDPEEVQWLDALAELALVHGQAGADFVAPATALDGQVGWIRETLDEEHLGAVGIFAWAARYRSAFTLPLDATTSPRTAGAPERLLAAGNVREALREATLDVNEGADVLVVRPCLFFLDVVGRLSEEFELPLVGFIDPAEQQLIEAGARAGRDRQALLAECVVALRRAGADAVVTPYALQLAQARTA